MDLSKQYWNGTREKEEIGYIYTFFKNSQEIIDFIFNSQRRLKVSLAKWRNVKLLNRICGIFLNVCRFVVLIRSTTPFPLPCRQTTIELSFLKLSKIL